jgi:hypothetical protein
MQGSIDVSLQDSRTSGQVDDSKSSSGKQMLPQQNLPFGQQSSGSLQHPPLDCMHAMDGLFFDRGFGNSNFETALPAPRAA